MFKIVIKHNSNGRNKVLCLKIFHFCEVFVLISVQKSLCYRVAVFQPHQTKWCGAGTECVKCWNLGMRLSGEGCRWQSCSGL